MIWVPSGGPGLDEPPADRRVTAVRSITIDCEPGMASAYLLAMPSADSDGEEAARRVSSSLISIDRDGDEILIGLQPLSADACVLHIVIAGEHDSASRKRISGWAQALRHILETSAARSGAAA